MADIAMAPTPAPAMPAGDMLEALKYAAQADIFQDDPKFYSWLEDWIGKQDEESIMIDAFTTLQDFGNQFDFQQQQQRNISESDAAADRMDTAASGPAAAQTAAPDSQPTHLQQLQDQDQHQQLQQQALDHIPGGNSSCASLASRPSSHPSDDNCLSLSFTNTASTSSPSGSVAHSAAAALYGSAFPPLPAGPRSALSWPAAVTAPNAELFGALASGPSGLDASCATTTTTTTTTTVMATNTAPGGGPFDAASFTLPLSRAMDNPGQGFLPELQAYYNHRRDTSATGSSGSFSLLDPSLDRGRIASHGTVSSFVGQPAAPPPQPAAAAAAAACTGGAASPQGRRSAPGGPRSSINRPMSLSSLEQLIARAICGNGSDANRAMGTAGGLASGLGGDGGLLLGGLGSLLLPPGGGLKPEAAATSAVATTATAAVTAAAATTIPGAVGPSEPLFGRNSGGSGGDDTFEEAMAAGTSRRRSGREDGLLLLGTLGGGSSGGRSSRLRRKSSSSGLAGGSATGHGPAGHHGHGGGIPVSHAHVGKVAVAGWARVGGGGGGAPAGGGGGGGRLTRSARAKAVFTALEAEVAGKQGELEALQREHATLTQRVEILEVAVERQSVVLGLMNAAEGQGRAAGGGAAAAAAAATAELAATQRDWGEDAAAPAPAAAGQQSTREVECSGRAGSGPGLGPNVAAEEAARPGPGPGLTPAEVLAAGPGSRQGTELLEWARTCTMETYIAWYKEYLQNLSLALLALEEGGPNPEAEARLVQLVAACWVRSTLVSVLQPLTQLRLKGLNLETRAYVEPAEQHWMDVIKFMTVSPEQVAEMENLFHSYNLLHGSFRSELQDTQRDLTELLDKQDGVVRGAKHCTELGLSLIVRQTALLKRVRSILQKTHLLYSSTIGVAALRILKPKEFAKCAVHSYPYYPCGPSLMKACAQLRAMKAIWGIDGCC